MRNITDSELDALRVFAARFGRDWKDKLSFEYWYNARIYRDAAGKEYPELHKLRNDLGPKWLASFNL
jgi:hypothetical protein